VKAAPSKALLSIGKKNPFKSSFTKGDYEFSPFGKGESGRFSGQDYFQNEIGNVCLTLTVQWK
jgi:hypothetical protein